MQRKLVLLICMALLALTVQAQKNRDNLIHYI